MTNTTKKITTIEELRAAMMLTKKTDKARSKVLGFLLDRAQKIAKEDKNRVPVNADIETAAKALMKQAEQSKALHMDVDYEMSVLQEFLPEVLSYEETEVIIKTIAENLTSGQCKNLGSILGTLKKNHSDLKIDMKVASEITKTLI